jgi:hypothetical protein
LIVSLGFTKHYRAADGGQPAEECIMEEINKNKVILLTKLFILTIFSIIIIRTFTFESVRLTAVSQASSSPIAQILLHTVRLGMEKQNT